MKQEGRQEDKEDGRKNARIDEGGSGNARRKKEEEGSMEEDGDRK